MVNIDKITDKVSSKINKENISRLGDKLNTKLNDNIDKINKFGDKLNNKISDNIDRLSSKQSGQTSQNFDNQAMCLNVDSNETLVANDEIPHEIKPTFSLAEVKKIFNTIFYIFIIKNILKNNFYINNTLMVYLQHY